MSLKRLKVQLYSLAFLKGLVFWYGIEKLFQAEIGLSSGQIITIGILAQVAIIVFEIPSSVFADRVSRKNTLILANIAMMICSVVLGVSSTYIVYVVGIVFWALSDALSSGVFQAFTYDSLVTFGEEEKYRSVISKMIAVELLVLGLGGIVAGLIGNQFGLSYAFYISAIAPVLSILLLVKMIEPPITRTSEQGLTWIKHLHEGLRVIFKRSLIWASVGIILQIGLRGVWYEYYQLVFIEVGMPKVIFGASIAFLTGGLLVGSVLASRYKASFRALLFLWVLIWASHGLLVLSNHFGALLLIMFGACVSLKALEVYFDVYIQNHVPSSQRATALSLISTVGRLYFFPLGLVFFGLSQQLSIRASFVVVATPFLLYGLITGFKRFKQYATSI